MVQLLKDSEKLFYAKIKEKQSQSRSLSLLIKQLWPVIKTRVRDPVSLMNTVNQCVSQSGNAPSLIEDAELMTSNKKGGEEAKELKAKYERQLILMDNVLGSKLAECSSLQSLVGAESHLSVQSSVLKAL